MRCHAFFADAKYYMLRCNSQGMRRDILLTLAGLRRRTIMVAVTYGVTRTADSKSAGKSKGLFTMLFEAIANSQMKRAERELARYHFLLARKSDEDEPFGGW
jgi:hypothetical protein